MRVRHPREGRVWGVSQDLRHRSEEMIHVPLLRCYPIGVAFYPSNWAFFCLSGRSRHLEHTAASLGIADLIEKIRAKRYTQILGLPNQSTKRRENSDTCDSKHNKSKAVSMS